MSAKTIAFAPRRKGGDAPLVINADTIRYIQMKRNYAEVPRASPWRNWSSTWARTL